MRVAARCTWDFLHSEGAAVIERESNAAHTP